MDQLTKAEFHTLKRKIENISFQPEDDALEKQLKNSRKMENLDGTQERITLSFNSFQNHLNSLKKPPQAETNPQNNFIISDAYNQMQQKEENKAVSGAIEGSFAMPAPKKLDSTTTTDLSNGQSNQIMDSEVNNNVNNKPFYVSHYEYHQINNTSFHTASLVKTPMQFGGTAFQSRKVVKNKMLSKTPEPKVLVPEESEPILVKTASDKPLYIDDALLQRFMSMFEE
jgi:hypothetical protein